MADNDEWTPKTREDWVNLFADGNTKAHNDREEAARLKAEEEAKNNPPDPSKDEPPVRSSFGAKLLGRQ